MKKKKADSGGDGANDWLNTYADMVTLLLTFFIMLFSMSSVESEKWEILVEAFNPKEDAETTQIVLVPPEDGAQVGTSTTEKPFTEATEAAKESEVMPQDFDDLYEYLKEYVEENNLQDSISLEKSDGSVTISFQNNLFFMKDSAYLLESAQEILGHLGNGLESVGEEILAVQVSGHTASAGNETVDVENYHVDSWDLSSSRATSVVKYMEDNHTFISPEKFSAVGRGLYVPVAANDTPEGKEKNRRVDILILSNEIDPTDAKQIETLINGMYGTDMDIAQDGTEAEVPTEDTEVEAPTEQEETTPDTEQQPESEEITPT